MKNKFRIKSLTHISLAAALMCVIAPLALPLGAFPLTLASVCLYLTALVFDPIKGAITVLIYLAVGFLGLPVFSSFTGGVQVLVSPTGGFLLAYLPAVFLASLICGAPGKPSLLRRLLALLSGMLVLYLGGIAGYVFLAGMPFDASLFFLLLPFLLGDLLKIAASLFIFTRIEPLFKRNS